MDYIPKKKYVQDINRLPWQQKWIWKKKKFAFCQHRRPLCHAHKHGSYEFITLTYILFLKIYPNPNHNCHLPNPNTHATSLLTKP